MAPPASLETKQEPVAPSVPKKAPVKRATPKVLYGPCRTATPSEDQGVVRAMVAAAFPDAPIMVYVADAESDFCSHADNPNSTAYGVFQILQGTWTAYGCTGSRGDAADNIKCARKIYDASGTQPWNASKSKWAAYL